MFLTNKYSKAYFNIVTRAMSRPLGKTVYTEKHHIIPKSLGGSNDQTNIAVLTLREHFICHLLLPKITTGKNKSKMWHAAWRMATVTNKRDDPYKISSRVYESIRIKHKEQYIGKSSWNKGIPRTQEVKDAISRAQIGNTTRKGAVLPETAKEKISKANKGNTAWNKGIPRTQEVKDAISKANKGNTAWNKGITRRWINDGDNQKLIVLEKLDHYLTLGWVYGRLC